MKDSEIVLALARMASMGKYDNVTPAQAREWNQLFVLSAGLVNRLEAKEAEEESEDVREGE